MKQVQTGSCVTQKERTRKKGWLKGDRSNPPPTPPRRSTGRGRGKRLDITHWAFIGGKSHSSRGFRNSSLEGGIPRKEVWVSQDLRWTVRGSVVGRLSFQSGRSETQSKTSPRAIISNTFLSTELYLPITSIAVYNSFLWRHCRPVESFLIVIAQALAVAVVRVAVGFFLKTHCGRFLVVRIHHTLSAALITIRRILGILGRR